MLEDVEGWDKDVLGNIGALFILEEMRSFPQ
jgi:hypothetical protein